MVYILKDEPNPKLEAYACEKIDVGNGEFSYQLVDTREIYAVNPEGSTVIYPEFLDGNPVAGQPWQRFEQAAHGLIANRTLDVRDAAGVVTEVHKSYLRLFAEGK